MKMAAETTHYMQDVERYLADALIDAAGPLEPQPDMLMGAARHLCIGSGAKRIRPLLVHLFAEALGGTRSDERTGALVAIGAAAEMIHTASLLHDDVVDFSPLRRGRPTVNALWGNVTAVMTGDMLLTVAIDRLLAVNLDVARDSLNCLAEMTRGTIVELEARGNLALPLEKMRFIAEAKTGALFGFCGEAVADYAGDADARARFSEFGRRIGIAFQIADDLKDLTGGDPGKPRFADLNSRTPSLPILLAAREDPALAKEITDAWAADAMTGVRLTRLGEAVLGTRAFERALARMHEEIDAAVEAFAPYRGSAAGQELLGLARQLAAAFETPAVGDDARVVSAG